MFQRLKKWFRLRRMARSGGLLRFHDGTGWRYADPFDVWRKLNSGGVDLVALAPFVDKGHEPETTQFLNVASAAFGVKRFNSADQTGLTDWEIVNLVGLLGAYANDVKKNTNPGPTSPSPTASECSTAQTDQAEPGNACGDCT